MKFFGTAKDACRAYNVHPQTLLRWAKIGKVRYKTGLGGRNRQYEIVIERNLDQDSEARSQSKSVYD